MYQRSEDYAKYWVEQGIAFYREVGKRIALAEFTNTNGMFVQDDVYIYVLDTKGVMLAHGINPRFVGEDFIDVVDSSGKAFIREMVDTANKVGSGWVEYNWYSPRRRRVLPKIAYFQKTDDMIFCSAIYREEED